MFALRVNYICLYAVNCFALRVIYYAFIRCLFVTYAYATLIYPKLYYALLYYALFSVLALINVLARA